MLKALTVPKQPGDLPLILAPIPIVANTSNTYAEVQAVSDSIVDAGYEIEITGDIDIGVNGRFNNLKYQYVRLY